MNPDKIKKLEDDGWKVGSTDEFIEYQGKLSCPSCDCEQIATTWIDHRFPYGDKYPVMLECRVPMRSCHCGEKWLDHHAEDIMSEVVHMLPPIMEGIGMRDIRALIGRDDIDTGMDAATLADQMEPLMFACPVCGDMYATREEAIECRDQPYDDGGLTVGTIVVVPGKSHLQFDEDDPWLAFVIPPDPSSNSHFSHAGYRVPYYVVTAIHSQVSNEHRCLVTLASLCGGYLTVGWNPANGYGHYALFRIDGGKHCNVDSTWIDMIEPYLNCKPPASMLEEAARLARVGISTRNLL